MTQYTHMDCNEFRWQLGSAGLTNKAFAPLQGRIYGILNFKMPGQLSLIANFILGLLFRACDQ